ncbi:MAG: radical SAM protein [Phycisphaerae bacterium]|jgi:hypothetical protein
MSPAHEPSARSSPTSGSGAAGLSAPDQLAVWEYAGLLVTYWCNARCAFCYVYSSPDRGGELRPADALRVWRGLDELAASHGLRMRIHLAGGEPLGDWPRLLSIVRQARDARLTPLEKVETNAFWAVRDGLTRARLEQLDALGMEKLVVSADVYHQEFVPFERVERCVRIAREVLGRGRVKVRWWDFFRQPTVVRRSDGAARREAYAQALARHADRLTGRAADMLPDFFERHAPEHFADQRCVREVLHSRHVHVDPYGNVFPGVCSGIILGNALATDVPALWRELAERWNDHPVVAAVVHGGSFELYERARALGYLPLPDGYTNKCHLCQHVRQYLFERGGWERFVGPAECYANARDKREAAEWTKRVRLTRPPAPASVASSPP